MKRNLLLGITGSVAAVRTVELVTALSEFANVRIILTRNASYFLEADLVWLREKGIVIYTDEDEWPALTGGYIVGDPILHIELRRWADVMLVAPLDANTLAKMSHGLCDNLVTSVIRAWDWQKPVFLCPAMNTLMWNNPPTAEHIQTMQNRGAIIIDPMEKKLACNDVGIGAMAATSDILKAVSRHCEPT